MQKITVEQAIEITRSFIPDKYCLNRYAEIGDEYWFDYVRSDGEVIIGASLVAVDKSNGAVRAQSLTQDFPRIRRTWNEAEKTPISYNL